MLAMDFTEEQLKTLAAEMRQVVLHFGRAAFQQPGYMAAAIREKMPGEKELCDALGQLDRAGVLAALAEVPRNDGDQQAAALEQARRTLAGQTGAEPMLGAVCKALQWQGTAWQAALQTPLAPARAEPDQDLSWLTGRDWKVGDQLQFGRYWKENPDQLEPITWYVLGEYEADQIWLMSKDILDAKPFCDDLNIDPDQICWAGSSLRQWLNTTFLQTAFNEEEQKFLVKTENFCTDAEIPDVGPDTEDLVSILNGTGVDLVEEYGTLGKRLLPAAVTPYAYSQGAYRDPDSGNGIWRLYSVGGWREGRKKDLWRENHPAQCRKLNNTVDCSGVRDDFGDSVFADYVGIRPVIVLSTGTEPAEQAGDAGQ